MTHSSRSHLSTEQIILKLKYMLRERVDMFKRNKDKKFAYRYIIQSRQLQDLMTYHKVTLEMRADKISIAKYKEEHPR